MDEASCRCVGYLPLAPRDYRQWRYKFGGNGWMMLVWPRDHW